MDIVVHNINEYIMSLIGLCGVKSENYQYGVKVSNQYYKRAVKNLIDEKLIRRSKDDREKIIGIKKPNGIKYLERIPELFSEYNLLTENATSPKTNVKKKRRIKQGNVNAFFVTNNIPVNFIKIIYRPPIAQKRIVKKGERSFTADSSLYAGENKSKNELTTAVKQNTFTGNELSFTSILKTLTYEKAYFFSSKAVKKEEGEKGRGTGKINLSRLFGQLYSQGNSYSVFYVRNPIKEQWNIGSEKRAQTILATYHLIAYKQPTTDVPAIFLIDDEKHIPDLMRNPTKDMYRKITPNRVYRNFHILPMTDNGVDVLRILITKGYKNKIKRLLFRAEYSSDNSSIDAFIDKVPTYEFISGNFKKIDHIKEQSLYHGNTVNIVCFKWQVDILKPLLKSFKLNIRTIEGKEKELLLDSMYKL